MNQIKTGEFIAKMRKEQNLTQKQLADVLLISDKTVSKWERGKGMPEVSLMLPLCDALHISVNELLSGERLSDDSYKKKAEENILRLAKEKEESITKIILSILVAMVTLLGSFTLIMIAGFLEMEEWTRIILIIIGLVILILGLSICAFLDMKAGTYECRKCGERFVPDTKAYIIGAHSITTRYLKCPKCGKKSFCKKRFTH